MSKASAACKGKANSIGTLRKAGKRSYAEVNAGAEAAVTVMAEAEAIQYSTRSGACDESPVAATAPAGAARARSNNKKIS